MNTEIKSAEEILDKKYQPSMHWKLVNRYKVIQAMEEYASQFKQPDISEDVWKAAEKHLTNLGIANTGGFTSRTILNSFKAGAKWQSQQPMPTVGEDNLWNEVGAILNNRAVSFTMYPKYLATLKKQFSITRK